MMKYRQIGEVGHKMAHCPQMQHDVSPEQCCQLYRHPYLVSIKRLFNTSFFILLLKKYSFIFNSLFLTSSWLRWIRILLINTAHLAVCLYLYVFGRFVMMLIYDVNTWQPPVSRARGRGFWLRAQRARTRSCSSVRPGA